MFRFSRLMCYGLAVAVMVATMFSPGLLMAQPTLPDVGIDLSAWVTAITGNWFALVAVVIGFVFIAAIVWKGVAMLSRRLTPTR